MSTDDKSKTSQMSVSRLTLCCFVVLGITALAFSARSRAQDRSRTTTDHSLSIQKLVEESRYKEALRTSSIYSAELESKYISPEYKSGVFRDEANHILLFSTFEGWAFKSDELGGGVIEKVAFALEKDENNWLTLLIVDSEAQATQAGGGGQTRDGMVDETVALNLAENLIATVAKATIKSSTLEDAGEFRVLIVEGEKRAGESVAMVIPLFQKRLFVFVLNSSSISYQENLKKTLLLVESCNFNYSPTDVARIQEILRRVDEGSLQDLLKAVGRLADIEEYQEATKLLSKVRRVIGGQIPDPAISGQIAHHLVYGIALINPDADRRNLEVEREGTGVSALHLLDRDSVYHEGVSIYVMDDILVLGINVADRIGSGSEAEVDEFVAMMGRSLVSSRKLGTLESERLIDLKGFRAYEAIYQGVPGTREKTVIVPVPGAIVSIVSIVDIRHYDVRINELDRIIEGYWFVLGNRKEVERLVSSHADVAREPIDAHGDTMGVPLLSDDLYARLTGTEGPPPSEDCDQDDERGRMTVDFGSGILYICVDRGWAMK